MCTRACARMCACGRAIRMFFSSTCLLVVTRARADVDVIGDLKGRTADPFVPRVGAGQPRRHKSRGGGGPACRVAFREFRGVEEGGGQECEGDEAELRLDGQELFGRLSTCLHEMGLWCAERIVGEQVLFWAHLHMWRMCACVCARCVGSAPSSTNPCARSSLVLMQFTCSHRVSAFVISV